MAIRWALNSSLILWFCIFGCLRTKVSLSFTIVPCQPVAHFVSRRVVLHTTATSNDNLLPNDTSVTSTIPSTSFFSDSVFGDLASQVQSRVKVPPIPSPIIRFVVTQALRSMSRDLSVQLIVRIEEMLDFEKTATKDDDLSEDEVHQIARDIADELIAKNLIDVPMLDEKQEFEVLFQIFKVVFSILTTTESERRASMVGSIQNFLAHDLLGTKEGQKVLIQKINQAIDIPLLNENQEERVITMAIEACAGTLQTVFPPEIIHTLKGESSQSLVELKQFLIQKVNKNVDLIGLSEEQEESLIRTMVDLLIESYIDPTAAELLLLNKSVPETLLHDEDPVSQLQRRRDDLTKEAASIRRKIDLSRTRYERERGNLEKELNDVQQKIQELENEVAGEGIETLVEP
jgi:hypothetical protein